MQLELKMRLPKALGGPGTEHNPEELFGMAWGSVAFFQSCYQIRWRIVGKID